MKEWVEGKVLYTSSYSIGGLVFDIYEKADNSTYTHHIKGKGLEVKAGLTKQKTVSGEIRVYDAQIAGKTLQKRKYDSGFGRIYYEIYIGDKVGRIKDIYITEQARNLGAGRDLVKLAERRIKEWGAERVSGYSMKDAINFWRKYDYDIIGHNEISKIL